MYIYVLFLSSFLRDLEKIPFMFTDITLYILITFAPKLYFFKTNFKKALYMYYHYISGK